MSDEDDQVTCAECGFENPLEAERCQNCGADLPAAFAENLLAQVPGQEPFINKARITPAQQVHLRLLGEMLAVEGQALLLGISPRRAGYTTLRIGTSLVLFLVLLFSLLANKPVFTHPSLTSEALEARQLVYALTPGAPVLFVVDYQPGFSGEMTRLGQGVLAHILAQRAYPVFLSTHPTGPAQAEVFITDLGINTGIAYLTPDQYLNLGYLPGGPSGLLSFSQAPQQVMPLTADGNSAWQDPPLQTIQSLSDFSLVLVMTEDPDTARTWIEQAGPQLQGKPLMLLLSAQAEPSLRPYLESGSGQVQGMVSGVSGGVAYQDSAVFTLQSDTSGITWSAYSLGLWVGAILLLLAGLYGVFRLVREQENELSRGDKP